MLGPLLNSLSGALNSTVAQEAASATASSLLNSFSNTQGSALPYSIVGVPFLMLYGAAALTAASAGYKWLTKRNNINEFSPSVLKIYVTSQNLLALMNELDPVVEGHILDQLKKESVARKIVRKIVNLSLPPEEFIFDESRDYSPRSRAIWVFTGLLASVKARFEENVQLDPKIYADPSLVIAVNSIKNVDDLKAYDAAFKNNEKLRNELYALLAEKIQLNKVTTVSTPTVKTVTNKQEFIKKMRAFKIDLNAISPHRPSIGEIFDCMLGDASKYNEIAAAFGKSKNLFVDATSLIRIFKIINLTGVTAAAKRLISALDIHTGLDGDAGANVISEAFMTATKLGIRHAAANLLIKYGDKINADSLENAFETSMLRWSDNREQNKEDYDFSEGLLKLDTFPKTVAYQFAKGLEETNKPLAYELQMGLLALEHDKALAIEYHKEIGKLRIRLGA